MQHLNTYIQDHEDLHLLISEAAGMSYLLSAECLARKQPVPILKVLAAGPRIRDLPTTRRTLYLLCHPAGLLYVP